jgi:hypothetical protein
LVKRLALSPEDTATLAEYWTRLSEQLKPCGDGELKQFTGFMHKALRVAYHNQGFKGAMFTMMREGLRSHPNRLALLLPGIVLEANSYPLKTNEQTDREMRKAYSSIKQYKSVRQCAQEHAGGNSEVVDCFQWRLMLKFHFAEGWAALTPALQFSPYAINAVTEEMLTKAEKKVLDIPDENLFQGYDAWRAQSRIDAGRLVNEDEASDSDDDEKKVEFDGEESFGVHGKHPLSSPEQHSELYLGT